MRLALESYRQLHYNFAYPSTLTALLINCRCLTEAQAQDLLQSLRKHTASRYSQGGAQRYEAFLGGVDFLKNMDSIRYQNFRLSGMEPIVRQDLSPEDRRWVYQYLQDHKTHLLQGSGRDYIAESAAYNRNLLLRPSYVNIQAAFAYVGSVDATKYADFRSIYLREYTGSTVFFHPFKKIFLVDRIAERTIPHTYFDWKSWTKPLPFVSILQDFSANLKRVAEQPLTFHVKAEKRNNYFYYTLHFFTAGSSVYTLDLGSPSDGYIPHEPLQQALNLLAQEIGLRERWCSVDIWERRKRYWLVEPGVFDFLAHYV
ncbi:MAG: hypothetical protein AAGJ82_15815, partial [Bacteroidota bacterium]